jgi:hypothetical protein
MTGAGGGRPEANRESTWLCERDSRGSGSLERELSASNPSQRTRRRVAWSDTERESVSALRPPLNLAVGVLSVIARRQGGLRKRPGSSNQKQRSQIRVLVGEVSEVSSQCSKIISHGAVRGPKLFDEASAKAARFPVSRKI